MKKLQHLIILSMFLASTLLMTLHTPVTIQTTGTTSTTVETSNTAANKINKNSLYGNIRVAVYNEPNITVPAYSSAENLTNHLSEFTNLLNGDLYEVDLLSTADILDHQLSPITYDVFVMINNVPRENITHLVKEFWLAGGSVLSFNSAISYLFYSGLLLPESEGADPRPFYWNYLPVEEMNMTSRHPITKAYQINQTISERPNDWVAYYKPMWETLNSKIPVQDLNFLLGNYTEPDHGYGLAIDHSFRGGKVVQLLGDGQDIPNQMESIILNAVEWLAPKPKARIAYDISHSPRLCIDSWDAEFGAIWDSAVNFGQLRNTFVNHSYIVDKFYPKSTGNFTAARLAQYDMLIIAWPNLNFTVAEQQAMESWVSSGGSLLVLGDRAGLGGLGEAYLNYLLSEFSISLSGDNAMDNVYAEQGESHPTLENCAANLNISYRNYITIDGGQTKSIWKYLGHTVVATQAYDQGRIMLASDMNIFDSVRLGDASNYQFAINAANWLSSARAEILVFSSNDVYDIDLSRVSVATALNQLDVRYYLTGSVSYLNTLLYSQTWSLVIIDEGMQETSFAYTGVLDHLNSGGKLLMSSWCMDLYPNHPLWSTLGVEFTAEWNPSTSSYLWDPSHSLFNIPLQYNTSTLNTTISYADIGDEVKVLDHAHALAGATETENINRSGLVIRNDGQTLLNTYLIGALLGDADDSTYADAYELWLNEICYMMGPQINSPADLQYEAGSSGNVIPWMVSSWNNDPGEYQVEVEGTTYDSGIWHETNVTIKVDGMDPGTYTTTLYVTDALGVTTSDTVIITVQDTINPVIYSQPDLVTSAPVNITWIAQDLYPESWRLYIDGTETASGIWVDQAISTSISDVEPGTYNFTLVVTDTSGNQGTDTVMVIVNEPSELIEGISDDMLLLIGGAVLGGLILIWLLVRRRRSK